MISKTYHMICFIWYASYISPIYCIDMAYKIVTYKLYNMFDITCWSEKYIDVLQQQGAFIGWILRILPWNFQRVSTMWTAVYSPKYRPKEIICPGLLIPVNEFNIFTLLRLQHLKTDGIRPSDICRLVRVRNKRWRIIEDY